MDNPAFSSSPAPRLAILGGGISGLASAFWVTELLPRAQVTLLESGTRFGGVIGTQREGAYLLETGPMAFPTGGPATAALLRAAGLEDLCLPSNSHGGIGLWNGRDIIPAPRSAFDVIRRNLLSPSALFRLLAEPFIPGRRNGADVSIREFFRRRTGEDFFSSLMEPLAAGVLAGDPASLSMRANLPRLHAMERDSGSLALGICREKLRGKPPAPSQPSRLPSASTTPVGCHGILHGLVEELERRGVRMLAACKVRAVRRIPDGFSLAWESPFRGTEEEFDGVISAIPSFALAEVEADWPEGVAGFLSGIPHASLSPVFLAYRKEDLSRDFRGEGVLPQPKAGEDALSCFIPSRMAPGRCPGDEVLVRFLLGGARKPHMARLEDGQAVAVAGRAAQRILGATGSPRFAKVLRHGSCLPQLVVGHIEALTSCREALRREWPGFLLAGTSYQGPGIENAAASARLAAVETARRFHPAAERAAP